MPLPDPYADELTVEIDRDKYKLWQEAKAAAQAWDAEAKRLGADLLYSMHGFSAATIDGVKVLSHRFKNQYAVGQLLKDYPDLTKHFMKPELVEQLDVPAFVTAHPEIAEKYRVRELRRVE